MSVLGLTIEAALSIFLIGGTMLQPMEKKT